MGQVSPWPQTKQVRLPRACNLAITSMPSIIDGEQVNFHDHHRFLAREHIKAVLAENKIVGAPSRVGGFLNGS